MMSDMFPLKMKQGLEKTGFWCAVGGVYRDDPPMSDGKKHQSALKLGHCRCS